MPKSLLFPCALIMVLAAATLLPADVFAENTRPNVLFLSVDDMSCDSVGVFGCPVEDTTPNIDRLATQGLRFQYAHVQVGNCMPSRNVMFSGRYPHNNRVEGFYPVKTPGYPVLADLFNDAGYLTAIRGKVSHSTPYSPYDWGLVLDTNSEGKKAHPKDVASYYHSTKQGIAAAKAASKPFCLLVNVSDPHKPFYGKGKGNQAVNDPYKPSKVFTSEEIVVPGFLPDVPQVRDEVALYYSTVRRADDCVGEVMRALEESGQAEHTAVVFLSDHGMPLPFAKTALYHHSTRTPWIVRWPGMTGKNIVDREHMISAIDLLPTLLDIAGISHPQGLEGRSFEPLLRGEKQTDREYVVKVYNENSGAGRHPMRSIQTKRFGYLFNPWSDGERTFKTATTGTASYRAMKSLAASNPKVAARVQLFDHRVVEEFYDYESDPDALNNLIDDPAYAKQIQEHREHLINWMKKSKDHALPAMLGREDPTVLDAYVTQKQEEADARRKLRRGKNRRPASANGGRKPGENAQLAKIRRQAKAGKFIQFQDIPTRSADGFLVKVVYRIPADLGEQKLHVSLRDGMAAKRYERIVTTVSGSGVKELRFQPLPDGVKQIRWAAFLGESYDRHLLHLLTDSAPAP